MKRVLLVAYYFPPRVATGSLRATYLAKYLPQFNWQPTVVTARFSRGVPPPWATVVQTEYTDVVQRARRFARLPQHISAHSYVGSIPPRFGRKMTLGQRLVESAYKVITFPDPQIGWFHYATQAITALLREGGYDAIVSTSYPYTAHLAVRKALSGNNIKWLADLRDPWRGNHYLASGVLSTLHALLEQKTLRRATAITTVSAPLATLMAKNNPKVPTFEIPNAFDPDDWTSVPFKRPAKFTLTYAGSLLQGFRNPEPLFDALIETFQAGTLRRDRVAVEFFVSAEPWLSDAVKHRGLEDVVTVKGPVERSEVLRAERTTSANLLLLRDHSEEVGVYTGKVFEYLGAGRPIIAIGGPPESVVKDLMARTGGWYLRSVPEIRAALSTLYDAYMSGKDIVNNNEVTEQFSAQKLARRFADVLDSVL